MAITAHRLSTFIFYGIFLIIMPTYITMKLTDNNSKSINENKQNKIKI